ncbi:hypothetical protein WDU94_004167 [Cyamophila willieti]
MLILCFMVLAFFNRSFLSSLQEDECDLLYGQGCICNMSQVLQDFENILQSSTGFKVIATFLSDASLRIVQYKCSSFMPLPRGFDITLLTTPTRVGTLTEDVVKVSMTSEDFNKAIYEYTLIENANIIYAFPGSDQRFNCIVGSREFLKDIDSVSYTWNFNKNKNLTSSGEYRIIHEVSTYLLYYM